MLFVTYDGPREGGQSDAFPPTIDEGTGSDRMDAANVVTSGQAARAAEELSERDQDILAFERQWWRFAGAKEQAIRETFDMSATRYYQVLNALIDREASLAYDPLLVKRLRRLRTARQRARSARRLGIEI
jgi:hypothetical protein